MNRRVLLLEPNYKNKFPPIGLMKLATYFKRRGDYVVFYKGDLKSFVINQIADECIEKLISLDDTIDWRIRKTAIANYIHTRKKTCLNEIGVDDSGVSLLLYPWLEYYKKFYNSGEYKKHPRWDWVGVTTLFTFYWDITIETIEFAKTMVKDLNNLMVGGVLASIQPKEIEAATGIRPHIGTLHTPHKDIDPDNEWIIDELPLDYSILEEIDYVYPDSGAYYSYTTRGCIRKCPFCAVWTIEPTYKQYIPLTERIEQTRRLYGDQQNLLLMDNNILASDELEKIIKDIKDSGFTNGSKYIAPDWYSLSIRNLRLHINDRGYTRKAYNLIKELNSNKLLSPQQHIDLYSLREKYNLIHLETTTRHNLVTSYHLFIKYFNIVREKTKSKGRLRFVDFNQGVDARLFNEHIVKLLAEIPVRPLRIAFDNIQTEKAYTQAIMWSKKKGLRDFSNYLLYNYNDTPEELYYRMRINVDLCEALDVSIYSFPMKFHPIKGDNSHDRDYIGKHWNRKYIRAVQAILNATKGKIGRGQEFFEKAFGKNVEEYMRLLLMPETFILFRYFFEHKGQTQKWEKAMEDLTAEERDELYPIIFKNDFSDINSLTDNPKFLHILSFYKNYRKDIADPKSNLHKEYVAFEASRKEK